VSETPKPRSLRLLHGCRKRKIQAWVSKLHRQPLQPRRQIWRPRKPPPSLLLNRRHRLNQNKRLQNLSQQPNPSLRLPRRLSPRLPQRLSPRLPRRLSPRLPRRLSPHLKQPRNRRRNRAQSRLNNRQRKTLNPKLSQHLSRRQPRKRRPSPTQRSSPSQRRRPSNL